MYASSVPLNAFYGHCVELFSQFSQDQIVLLLPDGADRRRLLPGLCLEEEVGESVHRRARAERPKVPAVHCNIFFPAPFFCV